MEATVGASVLMSDAAREQPGDGGARAEPGDPDEQRQPGGDQRAERQDEHDQRDHDADPVGHAARRDDVLRHFAAERHLQAVGPGGGGGAGQRVDPGGAR